ncbi:hypothetical protein MWMV7_MWMV7_00519 [Acinetobacter calcoaceticus]|uniref:hypothetical protein n=1 Tax=Acinetobacter sp. WU_MDCI_Abxb74 TaxID=2850072 RepID=UPI0021CD1CBF|nr:hypothetical protein [Acinetobacter sp. WU_MDCI_Abxb74]MCU4423191.1 hypothetical protein [Acinetobacter sp. WU_MDCI_Abxb74]CAI3108571.1 hypothetical protein MWMV7_MWMV7_00519 [Acinetobacter calcoaceticus]
MRKTLIGALFLTFGASVSAASKIEKEETKKFSTMKQCIEWLDSKYPNSKWHKDSGASWNLENDNSNFLSGITHVPSDENRKLTHPIAIYCKLKETSTEGLFYEGKYIVIEAI